MPLLASKLKVNHQLTEQTLIILYIALPPLSVSVTEYIAILSNFSMLCTINTIDRLIISVNYDWTYPIGVNESMTTSGILTSNSSEHNVTLQRGAYRTSYAGKYECRATITISQINIVSSSSQVNVKFQCKLIN